MSAQVTWQWDPEPLDNYCVRLAVAADAGAHEAALDVEMLAQQYVAVETGSLHDTIDVEQMAPANYSVNAGDIEGGYKGGGKGSKKAGSPVDYAVHQEYNGTPFMTPAAEEAFQAFQSDIAARIAQA